MARKCEQQSHNLCFVKMSHSHDDCSDHEHSGQSKLESFLFSESRLFQFIGAVGAHAGFFRDVPTAQRLLPDFWVSASAPTVFKYFLVLMFFFQAASCPLKSPSTRSKETKMRTWSSSLNSGQYVQFQLESDGSTQASPGRARPRRCLLRLKHALL